MRRRILAAILSITLLAIVLFGVPLALVVERFVDNEATLRLERHAVLASRDVPRDFATNPDPVELPSDVDGIVLGLYGIDGRLVTGHGPATGDDPTRQALGNEITDVETADTRVVAVPVSANERVVGVIRAEQPTSGSNARSARIIAVLAALAAGVLLIGAVVGWVVAGRLARPVQRLSEAAVRLGDGDFTVDVPRSRIPELDQAGVAMTATAARLDDLVDRERAFSGDASHQLRTPLAGMRTAIETELAFPRPDRTEVLHEALEDIDRLERTVSELLTLARTPSQASVTLTLGDVLDDVGDAWHGRFAAVGRPLTIVDAHDVPPLRGNPTMLRHALDALVDNSLVHGAGVVRIDHRLDDDTVTVSVRDEGAGFAVLGAGDGRRDDDGGPHGMGLSLARRLVEALPGRLSIAHTGPQPRIDIVLALAVPTPPPSQRGRDGGGQNSGAARTLPAIDTAPAHPDR